MHTLKHISRLGIITSAFTLLLSFGAAPLASNVSALNPANEINSGVNSLGGSNKNRPLKSIFKTVTNVILFILGAIAVIMIIVGGIRYTASGGDSNAAASAKNTILYAVVGLIIALLAYALVNFVISAFTKA